MITLLVAFSIVSALWSVAPEDTLRRSIALLVGTLVGFYLAERFAQIDLLRLLAVALSIIMISSGVFALMLPSLGIMSEPHEGAWRGVFSHKNSLGRYAVLSVAVFAFLMWKMKTHRWFLLLGLGLSFAIPVLSSSKNRNCRRPFFVSWFVFHIDLSVCRPVRSDQFDFFVVVPICRLDGWIGINSIWNPLGPSGFE